MKLYTNSITNTFTQSALVVADMANVKVDVELKDKNDKEFKGKLVTGLFPLLELESGELVFESAAIALHFARMAPESGLLGQTPFQTAQVNQWVAFTQTQFKDAFGPVLYAVFGHRVVDASAFNEAVKVMKSVLKTLDTQLKGKSFLVGESVSVADVYTAALLSVAFATVLDAGFRKAMPNVTAWFERCASLPSFVRRFGYVKMAEKAMKAFDPNAKPEPVQAKVEEKKPETKEEDDDLDLFGDDDEEDAEAAKKAAQAAKDKATANKKKKSKEAMSLVMLEVKPLDDTVNLDDLAQKIFKEITQEALYWKTQYKKEPIAFGIFKLIIGFSLEDEKVSVDDVIERIEGLEDYVQSVEIQAFNKI